MQDAMRTIVLVMLKDLKINKLRGAGEIARRCASGSPPAAPNPARGSSTRCKIRPPTRARRRALARSATRCGEVGSLDERQRARAGGPCGFLGFPAKCGARGRRESGGGLRRGTPHLQVARPAGAPGARRGRAPRPRGRRRETRRLAPSPSSTRPRQCPIESPGPADDRTARAPSG